MDPSRRQRTQPPRQAGGTYRAFVPEPLVDHAPRIPSRLSRLAAAVEHDLAHLARTDTAEALKGMAHLLMRSEAISSSKIEGITLAPDKIALAELAESEEIKGVKHSTELVARNLGMLRHVGSELADSAEITVADICRLQENLIGSSALSDLRTSQNWIGGADWTPSGPNSFRHRMTTPEQSQGVLRRRTLRPRDHGRATVGEHQVRHPALSAQRSRSSRTAAMTWQGR